MSLSRKPMAIASRRALCSFGAWSALPRMHEALESFSGTARAYVAKAAEMLDELEESDDVDAASSGVIALVDAWSRDEATLQIALEVVAQSIALGYGCCLTDRDVVARLAKAASAHGAATSRKSALQCLLSLTKCSCTNHATVVYASLSVATLDSLQASFPKCKATRKATVTFRAHRPAPPAPGVDAAYDAKLRAAERAAAALIAEEERQKTKKLKIVKKSVAKAKAAASAAAAAAAALEIAESASEEETEIAEEAVFESSTTQHNVTWDFSFDALPTCALVLHAIDIEIYPNDFF